MASPACVTSRACVTSSANVTSTAYMTAPISHLVSAEVIERPISMRRKWTMVTVMWIKAVINMAIEVVRAVEPWAGPDEDSSSEPLGSVVPIWSTVVR